MNNELSLKILRNIDKFKIPIGLSIVGVVLIIGGMIASDITTNKQTRDFPKASLVAAQKVLAVDVSGAVINPGVYQLQDGSRVEDAIKAAGGLSESASGEFVSKSLNLAQKLSDGMKIYIPVAGESGMVMGGLGVAGVNSSTKVNINSASQTELEALPGIGPVTAAKIISGRPFKNLEDLLNQRIVQKSTFEKIKDSISVF